MKCPVCFATAPDSQGPLCSQCQFDTSSEQAANPAAILAAREVFKQKASAYAPDKRVTTWDAMKPWIAVVLGFIIFMFWLRACSSGGWKIF